SALYQGDFAAARSMLEESLAILMKSGDKWLIAIFLTELAGAVAAQGQPMGAARLWGAMETLREEIGAPIAPILRAIHEHMVTTARAQLDEETFAAAWAEGR